MHPFLDLQPGLLSRVRERRLARLARLALVLRELLYGLGVGVLCALVGTIWFVFLAAVIVLAGLAGNRYLRK